jgi:enoyl-CoA hydratase/carnithine racemase
VSEDTIIVEHAAAGTVRIIINRPARLNAIDLATSARLRAALADAAQDDAVRTVILSGVGDKAFSAGFDIHEMTDFERKDVVTGIVDRDPLIWEIASHPKVVISAINGICHGAGALIAAASDMRIGGPDTSFRVTATKYGSANATWTLPALVGVAKAKEILLTGRAVDAAECLDIGLLNYLVPADLVLSKALELAADVAANPPQGALSVKALITNGIGKSLEAQYHAEQVMMLAAPSRNDGGGIFDGVLASRPSPDRQERG